MSLGFLQASRGIVIRPGLVVPEQAQKSEKPRAELKRRAGSRIGHVGDSRINQLARGAWRPSHLS